jgi:transcriptional regulator with XRE-family HTH domain
MYPVRAYRPGMAEEPCDRLRRAREARYKTIAEACKAFGWPYETYKKTENGERKLTLEKAERYGPPLGKAPMFLLTGKGPETAPITEQERDLLGRFRVLTETERDTVFMVCDRLYQGHETVTIEDGNNRAKKGR